MAHVPVQPNDLPAGRIFLTSQRGHTLRLPASWRLDGNSLPAARPGIEITGRSGLKTAGPRTVGVRTGSLSGNLVSAAGSGSDAVFAVLWPPDAEGWGWGPVNTQVDALNLVLQDSPLTLHLDSMTGRHLQIEVTNVAQGDPAFFRVPIQIAWEAKDPLWTSHEASVSSGVMPRSSTRIITVDGTAPARPLITITGQTGGTVDPELINETNGTSLHYAGTLNNGNVLELDCNAVTASRSAVSVLGSMSDSFALGFRLEPGENALRLNTASGNALVKVEYQDRWY